MYLWCESCQNKTQTISGKYDIRICYQCGCEVRHDAPDSKESQETGEPLINQALQIAGDEFEGEPFAEFRESVIPDDSEAKLETARYLPSEFYETEAELAEEVSDLDEKWEGDHLLEKIQKLEESLRPIRRSESKPKLRVDMGHVASQRELNAPTTREKKETSESERVLPIARKLSDLQEIRIDPPASSGNGDLGSAGGSRSVQITSLALVTTWTAQILVGISCAPLMGPTLWSTWLITQTAGSICLGMALYNLFPRRDQVLSERASWNSHNQNTVRSADAGARRS